MGVFLLIGLKNKTTQNKQTNKHVLQHNFALNWLQNFCETIISTCICVSEVQNSALRSKLNRVDN